MEKVKRDLITLIDSDYLLNLDDICERAILGVGIRSFSGRDVPGVPLPFIRWQEDGLKTHCRDLTHHGWEAFKKISNLMRMKEILWDLHEVARAEVGRELRPRQRMEQVMTYLSDFNNDPTYKPLMG